MDKKRPRDGVFSVAKGGRKSDFRPWKFCGTSRRGSFRSQKSVKAPGARLSGGRLTPFSAAWPFHGTPGRSFLSRVATRSHPRGSVKGRGSVEIAKGVDHFPQVDNILWKSPVPVGETPCSWTDASVQAAGRLGFGRAEAVVTGSPMEGTSGAADLALLRGRVREAALGSRRVRASDTPCAAASVHVARRALERPAGGLARAGRRGPASSGPSRGQGFVRWDRGKRVLSGACYRYRQRRCTVRSTGFSTRRSSDLTTRGVRADRVGVAPAPGRPKGQARERARRAGASRAMESSDTLAAGWWGLPT